MNLTSTTDTQAPAQPGALLNALREIALVLAAEDVKATVTVLNKVRESVGAVEVRLIVERPIDKELVKTGEKSPSFTTTVTQAGVFTDEGTERMIDLHLSPDPAPVGEAAQEPPAAAPVTQIVLPLNAALQRFGVFVLRFDPPRTLSASERTFLDTVSAQLSALVYNDYRKDNLNEFIQTISHDLKNTFTPMIANHEMIEQLITDGTISMPTVSLGMFQRIKIGMKQAVDIIQNVVDSAQLDPNTGYYQLARKTIDIIAMLNEIIQAHALDAEMRQIKVHTDIEPDLPLLSLDETLVKRAFNNLLDNAVKYSPDGSEIWVTLRSEDRTLVYAVRDNGFGIPAASTKLIFKKYFRLKRRGQERVKGTGLGLFIVKQIAQKHNGDALVQSEEGHGSTFTIRIPMDGENVPGAVISA